jgi:hypothetical protein
MRRANDFSKRLNRWELISTNAKPHLTEMPFLQQLVTDLDGVIVEAKSLDTVQEQNRQSFVDATHRRQELERRGETLRARITAHLKGTFGHTSDDLIQFGITPRPRTLRRKKAVQKTDKPDAATP